MDLGRAAPLCAVGAALVAAGYLLGARSAEVASDGSRASQFERGQRGGGLKDEEEEVVVDGLERRLEGMALSTREIERYGRQLVLPEFGLRGQEGLKHARVLVVGAGGLGSPVCLYLAAAGIQHLGIVDGDEVAVTNLHRQVLHDVCRVGQNKALSAVESCRRINDLTEVIPYPLFLDSTSAAALVPHYDVLVDATDNARTRYLLNDAAVIFKKPLVSGSALRWEGQLCVYNWDRGPCYRCLFPEPPPIGDGGACDLQGVVGPAPGLIGMMQALEVLKICGGLHSEVLRHRLLLFDGLSPTTPWRSIALRPKVPKCAVCGDSPSIRSLKDVDYEDFCPAAFYPPIDPQYSITPSDFASKYIRVVKKPNASNGGFSVRFGLDVSHPRLLLLDVRPAPHFDIFHIDGAINWPMEKFTFETNRIIEERDYQAARDFFRVRLFTLLPPSEQPWPMTVACVCRRGNDSSKATEVMLKLLAMTGLESEQRVLLPGSMPPTTEPIDDFNYTSSISILNITGGLFQMRKVAEDFRAIPEC